MHWHQFTRVCCRDSCVFFLVFLPPPHPCVFVRTHHILPTFVTFSSVWISVMAVLTIQFAKTIAMSLTITNFFKRLSNRTLLPLVTKITPREYRKWCPVILDWGCRYIGISIAWSIQTYLSAFASAMAGGLMLARAVLVYSGKNPMETMIDELSSYGFAIAGFYFQYLCGFHVRFPFNVVLLPVGTMEAWIRWTVTKLASGK